MKDEDKTREQLISELINLRQQLAEIEDRDVETKRTEEELKKHQHHLEEMVRERVKELNCFYGISRIVNQFDTLEEIFQHIVDLIPSAYQFPDITCARIIFETKEFKSKNFNTSDWKQTTKVKVNNKEIGGVEVYYLEARPNLDEGPFLNEERNLIEAITELLQKFIERKIAGQINLRLAEIIRNESNGVILTDSEGRILYVNPALEEMSGFTLSELLNRHPAELIVTDNMTVIKNEILSTVITKGEWTGELLCYRKNGEVYPVESRVFPIRNSKGEIVEIVAIQQDISQRKKAEKEIRKLNQYLESVIDNANVWMNVLDEKANVMIWNKAAEQISGYSREEVIGNDKIWKWLFPDDEYRNYVTTKVAAIIQKGKEVMDSETTIRCKNGEFRIISWHSLNLLDEKGAPIGSIAIGRDITEYKQSEEALKESERRYRNLFENSPISLWEEDHSFIKMHLDSLKEKGVKDFRTYLEDHPDEVIYCASMIKVIDVNKATLTLYKAKSKEEFLRGLNTVFCPETYPIFIEQLLAIANGETEFESETINQTFSGDKIDIFLSWSVAPGYEDTYSKVLVSIIDITERKRAEEEIRKKNEELETFVYMVSHDLKNPVVSIQGFCSSILKNQRDELNEKTLFYLQRVQANASLMSSLLEDLLELSRIGRIEDKKTEISVQEVIKSVWAGVSTSLATQDVEFILPKNLPQVLYSEKRLYQIFSNLLSNALKFRDEDRKTKVEIGHQEDKDNYTFFVLDNGIGIEQKYHNKIFESFSQLKDIKSEGTGMGLAIVKKIVETNQGKVWVESQKGAGSTFYFTIPKNV